MTRRAKAGRGGGEKGPNRAWIITRDKCTALYSLQTAFSFGPPAYPLRRRRQGYSPFILEKGNLKLREEKRSVGATQFVSE